MLYVRATHKTVICFPAVQIFHHFHDMSWGGLPFALMSSESAVLSSGFRRNTDFALTAETVNEDLGEHSTLTLH